MGTVDEARELKLGENEEYRETEKKNRRTRKTAAIPMSWVLYTNMVKNRKYGEIRSVQKRQDQNPTETWSSFRVSEISTHCKGVQFRTGPILIFLWAEQIEMGKMWLDPML